MKGVKRNAEIKNTKSKQRTTLGIKNKMPRQLVDKLMVKGVSQMNKQIYTHIYMTKAVRLQIYKHSCACDIPRKPLKNQKESQQTSAGAHCRNGKRSMKIG